MDRGALAVLSILEGPFITMVALGLSGLAKIPVLDLVATILPIVIGMVLGNLDADMRKFLVGRRSADSVFRVRARRADLHAILGAGLSGIVLGLITLAAGAVFNVLASRLMGGSGVGGMAASTTAGNAVATPTAIAAVDPRLGALVPWRRRKSRPRPSSSLLAPLMTAAYALAREAHREHRAHILGFARRCACSAGYRRQRPRGSRALIQTSRARPAS
jgi:hypothetical protein